MSLPGFTAEASLYKTDEYCYSVGSMATLDGDVHLAQAVIPKDIEFEFRPGACVPKFEEVCRWLCFPDGTGKRFCFQDCKYDFTGYTCY